jgi:two-component system sensor histidine kinase TctE
MDSGEARIDGEPTLLRELMANLLDNAIKYTPEGGEVTVALRSGDGASWLRVEDSGVGIPLSEQEHVFKRFYRVLGTGVEGSGLGLSIVAEVARLHSAQLSLTNRSDVPRLCVEVRFRSIVRKQTF